MKCIMNGYTEDHVVPAGKLVTLFSAPDYPMFTHGGRTANQAAFLRLSPPQYAKDPEVNRALECCDNTKAEYAQC